jgi:hypothetical protein
MGWSCSAKAGFVMRIFQAFCGSTSGGSNMYNIDGIEYFLEFSNREHDDGSITGTNYKSVANLAYKAGSVKIDGSGKVIRGNSILKRCGEVAEMMKFDYYTFNYHPIMEPMGTEFIEFIRDGKNKEKVENLIKPLLTIYQK